MAEAEKQQIELDLDNAEETEVEVDGVENPEVEESEASEASEDNFDKAKNKTQRRIDQLTKKMNESKRREDEAIRYAQNVQAEAKQLKERMETLDTSYVNEYTNRVETQMGTAEVDLARAMEIGDTNGVVEAQRKMTALAIENDRAQQAKIQQQRYAQQVQAQEQTQVQQPMPQQQPQPRRPDPKAEQWAERNSWFGDDEAMTYAAFGVHKRLVENEGFDPQTEDYYTELDKRMQDEFPHKLKNGGSKRPAQTVASVSRSTSGRSSGKKVRLTPSQVAIAKKLGVPLEEYAKYVKE